MNIQLNHQRGMSFIGILMILSMLGAFFLFGLRAFPLYTEYFSVKQAMGSVANQNYQDRNTIQKVRNVLQKNLDINDNIINSPIELGFEDVEKVDLYLHVNNFKKYQDIQNIVKEIELLEKFTSENMGTTYKLIIGPIDNKVANKLVSTFISKGYKENEIILE